MVLKAEERNAAALQAENAQLKRRLNEINDFEKSQCAKLLVKLACVEAERDAYRALGTVEELAALVKARDEGWAVALPCKAGDTLYTESPIRGMVTSFKAPDLAWIIENISEFGKTVFLTYAEAEAVLSAQKGDAHEADPV